MKTIFLYLHTVKSLKPSQVFWRLLKKIGLSATLGVHPTGEITEIKKFESPTYLDFDPDFLARFPAEDLMENRVSILHQQENFDWNSKWSFENRTALWNFNLHYFEFLFPLIKAWKDTGEKCYLDKTVEIIEGWIANNPTGLDPAWASYTLSLRIVVWISYFGYVSESLSEDFRRKFLTSLHDQYVFLSRHLEKDILGNHYFENLKTLILASIFFNEAKVLKESLKNFKTECKEQILPDGMHFELSPMYHKIIFEGVLRVAIALRSIGKQEPEIESFLQPMLDAAFSFEDGLERVPLFNDGGNNVAKSLEALIGTAQKYFGITPRFKDKLESAGFYIFVKTVDGHIWKLIVDAGQPGPTYIPGHAHCDAMSYELFRDGKPVIANCGTYAYQSEERPFFRSTAAHNTVRLNGKEQSQCWGNFRLAKRCRVRVLESTDDSISIEMTDANGVRCIRKIIFQSEYLEITDSAEGALLETFVHPLVLLNIESETERTECEQPYAAEFGESRPITCYKYQAKDRIRHRIELQP